MIDCKCGMSMQLTDSYHLKNGNIVKMFYCSACGREETTELFKGEFEEYQLKSGEVILL